MTMNLIHADLLKWLRRNQWLVANGFMPKSHAILSDPPYFLGSIAKRFGGPQAARAQYGRDGLFQRASRGFMGQAWDGFDDVWHFQAWVTEWSSMLLDFVYPGALGLFFGGSRTYHRLAAGLEDSGWEVVDAVVYLFGSGFPKSHSIGKAIDRAAGAERETVGIVRAGFGKRNGVKDADGGIFLNSLPEALKQVPITAPATAEAAAWEGYGTALKPAYEMVVICRAPRGNTTYADLAQQFGTGAYNIAGSRIGTESTIRNNNGISDPTNWRMGSQATINGSDCGRWPANLILDEVAADLLDRQSGELTSGTGAVKQATGAGHQGTVYGKENRPVGTPNIEYGDSGGASRFFYTAKAGGFEREAGLDAFTPVTVNDGRETPIDNAYQRGETQRRCSHPTMKPIELTEYLARLILPPLHIGERRILVPFGGVGSECIGAHLAGWDVITGIEREAEYVEQGRARLKWWAGHKTYEQAEAAWKGEQKDTAREETGQLRLFDVA